ncbi:MAG TPA: GGDEF domain-containing protein [Kofleriaceae bacterium]|nr:GGDEF domain-containing protein [Kofleriaceae bacterium]
MNDVAALIDALDQGAIVTGGDRVVAVNQALASTVGMAQESLLHLSRDGVVALIRGLCDRPPEVLREGMLFSHDGGVVCEEFELARPVRSVVRWLARRLTLADGDHQLATCTDITTEVDLSAAQARFALTDQLTGLMNRRAMEAALARETARVRRHGTAASVILCDVDHFKGINDRHGHAAGDQVLRRVAQSLAGAVRASDVCARWGGEEFLILLPHTPLAGARQAAETVRLAVGRRAQMPPAATLSAGVAEIGNGESAESALRRADACLYRAKAGGRNRVEI